MRTLAALTIVAAWCFSSIAAAGTSITVYNNSQSSGTADGHVFHGEYHVAQLMLPKGGNASVDTTPSYTIMATPVTGNIRYPDQPLKLEGRATTIETSVVNNNGDRRLQLISTDAKAP